MEEVDESRTKLLQELAELRQQLAELAAAKAHQQQIQEAQQAALRQVWEKVWRMKGVEEIDQVLSTIEPALIARKIPFLAYSINLVVDPQGEEPVQVYIRDPDGKQFLSPLPQEKPETRIILEAWRSRKILYRPDLAKENVYGEHLHPPQQPHHAQVRSAIDVPFSRGTLSLASALSHSLSPDDISFLQDLALALEGGFQRLEDLQRLEQRNQRLTEEIAERKQAEEALRQAEESLRVDLALQQVRNEVLQMQSEDDWSKIAVSLARELKALIRYEGLGINIVNLQQRTFFAWIVEPTGVSRGETVGFLPSSLEQTMRTQTPFYRRNRAEMRAAGDKIGAERHSALDVPFRGGTLALNSTREDAFSERDIHILEQFAQVLSAAYQRLEDLKALRLQEEQLRQAQKLEALGWLATGVAHEINNPLTSVIGYSQLLLRQEQDPKRRESLEIILREGERARDIAGRLLNFARRQQADRQWTHLNPLVQETLELVQHHFETEKIELVASLAEDLPLVQVHPGQLQQVVLELVQNSLEAIRQSGQGSQVEVRTYRTETGVRLEVTDDGPGIPAELRERIFEPFYAVQKTQVGGLGLSTCFRIAQEHHGRLWVEARSQGACLVLELPL